MFKPLLVLPLLLLVAQEPDTIIKPGSKGDKNCYPFSYFITRLKTDFKEEPVGGGKIPEGGMVLTIFASAKGKTWTLALTSKGSDGRLITCGVFYGTDWADGKKP